MDEIVCATRGGEGSRAVQMAAIAHAKATNKPLVFLYVAPATNYEHESAGLQLAIRKELVWLGKALLYVAKNRAENAGIPAKMVILEGNVVDEISNYLNESKASLLFLGAPRGTTAKLIGDDAIERFAARLQENTKVEVRIVRPEEAETLSTT